MTRGRWYMNGRMRGKTEEIERFVEELSEMAPSSLDEYRSDRKSKAACERYFEKIVEAIVDLAFLYIKDRGLSVPEEDKQAFDIMGSAGHIDRDLARRLKEAKGMRNILAHEYGQVDDDLVFAAITEEISRDALAFVEELRKRG